MNLSRLIKSRMGVLGLTSRALAQALEISEFYVSKILSAQRLPRSPRILQALSKALDVPESRLRDALIQDISELEEARLIQARLKSSPDPGPKEDPDEAEIKLKRASKPKYKRG